MDAQDQAPALAKIKEDQRQMWATGDYAKIGNNLVIMGELLCEAVDLRAGDRVLDVATGTGNTALSAARRGCQVIGIDFVPDLIEQARERAAAERLEIIFEVGDVEAIPYPAAAFDAVLSTIGVMFAPDQEKAALELLRVCKPGGKIGLACWTPDGFSGSMFRTIGNYVPTPPEVLSPLLWGTEERLREIFGGDVSSMEATRRSCPLRYSSAEHFVEHYRTYFGPVRKAFEALDATGQRGLARDLVCLVEDWSVSGDETIVLHSDYLEVAAFRR